MHLIIGKDGESVRQTLGDLLRGFKDPLVQFYPENFTVEAFYGEVETLPFLSKQKGVVVHAVDELPEGGAEALKSFLEKPSPWVALFLTAGSLAVNSKIVKLVEKQGQVIRFKEEKPWEKEKRLAEWLIQRAGAEKVRLNMAVAMALVQGVDHAMLPMELEKLICFVDGKNEITAEDVALLSTPAHHETLWKLGDALFAGETGSALSVGKALLEDGMAIFPLLASLRTQCGTGIGILQAAQQGEVAQKYPYLKGKLLDKKLQTLKKYGADRLREAMLLIFETEVQAKNSSTDPALLLELLTIKLTL